MTGDIIDYILTPSEKLIRGSDRAAARAEQLEAENRDLKTRIDALETQVRVLLACARDNWQSNTLFPGETFEDYLRFMRGDLHVTSKEGQDQRSS